MKKLQRNKWIRAEWYPVWFSSRPHHYRSHFHISLSSKFLRNLGSMLKVSSHALSTLRKHMTGFLVKSFGECCVGTRGGRSHFFRLRLQSCSKILKSVSGNFLIWESDSCSDSGYNHRSKRNLPRFYLRNDHTDSYSRNWKVNPDPGPVFRKFLTPGRDPGPKEKRRILPESTPVLRIRYYLWWVRRWRPPDTGRQVTVFLLRSLCPCQES